MREEREQVLRDPARLAAVHRLQAVTTTPDPVFDRLARLAARTLQVPSVLISLVEPGRLHVLSALGPLPSWASDLRYLEEQRSPLTTATLVMSGDISSDATRAWLEQRGRPVLLKPFTHAELARAPRLLVPD